VLNIFVAGDSQTHLSMSEKSPFLIWINAESLRLVNSRNVVSTKVISFIVGYPPVRPITSSSQRVFVLPLIKSGCFIKEDKIGNPNF
jgi:hypothetical protein